MHKKLGFAVLAISFMALIMTGCESDNNAVTDITAEKNVTSQETTAAEENITEEVTTVKEAQSAAEQTSDGTENEAATAAAGEEDSKLKKFGSFKSVTVDGKTVDDSIFADSDITMLNIWATYCGPCIDEMPDLAEINKEYSDKGVKVVGIVSDVYEGDDVKGAQDVISSTGADYTHILVSDDLYNGYLSDVEYVPTTVFVDKDGNIIDGPYVGSMSKEDWETTINNLLDK